LRWKRLSNGEQSYRCEKNRKVSSFLEVDATFRIEEIRQ
jgi:hypothetical protein